MAVRREAVRLEVEDRFTKEIIDAAAATKVLKEELRSLDRTSVDTSRSTTKVTKDVDNVGTAARRAGKEIDQLSGRVRILADVTAILGPSLAPIGALSVAAVGGLAQQLGLAAIGAGSLIVAVQGMGDALKAMNEAALAPTADNISKAREAMAQLGPDAQAFVTRFQQIRPALRDIKDAAGRGWFPGLTESLGSLEKIAPEVASLFEDIGRTGGDLLAEGAAAFAGPGWADFRSFIATEAPRALDELGRTLGNVGAGLAELWMAFGPLNRDFSTFLLDGSRSFREWADGLSRTQGFNEFLDYIETNGPRVAAALGALGNAIVQIVEAVAPLGGPSLKIIETFADAIAAIADSDLGTPIFGAVAALALYNRTLQATAALQKKIGLGSAGIAPGLPGAAGTPLAAGGRIAAARSAAADLRTTAMSKIQPAILPTAAETERLNQALGRTRANLSAVGRGAAGVGALGIAMTDAGNSTAGTISQFTLLGATMAGPYGAAAGAAIGTTMAFAKANDDVEASVQNVANLLRAGAGYPELAAALEQSKAKLDDFEKSTGEGAGNFLANTLKSANGLTLLASGGDGLAGLKNSIEGIFGKSDVEEVAAAYDKQAAAVAAARKETLALAASQEEVTKKRAVAEWAVQTADQFYSLAEAIKKPELSLNDLVKRFDEQATAQKSYGQNIRKALEAGVRPEALQKIIDELGPEASRALQEVADGGKAAADRINAGFDSSARSASALAGAIQKVGNKVDALPGSKTVDINARLRDENARAAIENLIRNRVVTISAVVATGKKVRGGLAMGANADGGTIPKDGLPYADRFPYLLAPGEEVVSNRFGQADRHRGLLKAINAGRLADGGTVRGGRGGARGNVASIAFAGLPSLDLAELGLKKLEKALDRSKKALEKETDQRDDLLSKRNSVASDVASRLTSDLFGSGGGGSAFGQSAGGVAAAIATLNKDIAGGNQYMADIAKLSGPGGLSKAALEEVGRNASPAQLAQFANSSPAQLAEFQRLYDTRAAITTAAGNQIGNAVYGADLARLNAGLTKVGTYVQQVEKAIRAEEKETRDTAKKGAGSAARKRRRG